MARTRPAGRAPARVAGDPLRLIEDHLEREAARIDDRRRELAAAREALTRLHAKGAPEGAGMPVERISAEMAPGVVSGLLHETTGMTRSYVMRVDDGPALDESTMRDNQQRIRDGLVQRAIYPVATLATPYGSRWIQGWGAIGEEQRVVTEAASEFAVFGSEAVVSLARWGEPASGYVMTREPIVVEAFTAYFDLAWSRALPVPASQQDRDLEAGLLELLGMGLKDEAIARYLGIGLRTVRRRVAWLMSVHGVDTRFQLGAAVERARKPGRAER